MARVAARRRRRDPLGAGGARLRRVRDPARAPARRSGLPGVLGGDPPPHPSGLRRSAGTHCRRGASSARRRRSVRDAAGRPARSTAAGPSASTTGRCAPSSTPSNTTAGAASPRPSPRAWRSAGAALLAGADCVVPVPLHRRRRRARGYNQAADLAARLPLPLVAALARTRATSPQAGLPAARRHANVRDAFSIRRGGPWGRRGRRAAAVRGRVVVLVDDVATTGATLDACARALKAAGAREVRALTAARVVLGPPTPRRPRPRPADARRR